MYVSKAELMRAEQHVKDQLNWYWAVETPPQGEPGFLEDLIRRGREFLAKNPGHQAAHARVAVLEDERQLREEAALQAIRAQRELAQQWDELHGHVCPRKEAEQQGQKFDGPCWAAAEERGWVCGIREATT